MTDTTTTTPPVLSIDGAAAKILRPDSDRETLRLHAVQVGQQHATYCAAEAAGALRTLFGETAHQAIFERTTDSVDGVDAHLLILFDADDNVIWYNREFLGGQEILAARDASDEPMPDLDRDTLVYIEGLIEWAEEAHYDGYLPTETLVTDPSEKHGREYEGHTIILLIDNELGGHVRAAGTPAHDGSTGPQRTVLSPQARDVAVLALQRILDNQGRMYRTPLDDDEYSLIAEVIGVLDPRERPEG